MILSSRMTGFRVLCAGGALLLSTTAGAAVDEIHKALISIDEGALIDNFLDEAEGVVEKDPSKLKSEIYGFPNSP